MSSASSSRAAIRPHANIVVSEDWASLAVVLALLVEHLAFGGNRTDLSLLFGLIQSLILAAVLLTPWGAKGFLALQGWTTAAVLFVMTIFVSLLSLAPLPFGGSDVWAPVGRYAMAAIDPPTVFIAIAKLLGYASVLTTAAILAADRRRASVLLRIVILSGLLFALTCLVLEGLSPNDVLGWQKPIIARSRVSGLFSSPNTAATVFGLYALLAIGAVLRGAERLKQSNGWRTLTSVVQDYPVEIAAFLLNFGCILLSTSRGGLGSFGMAFLILIFWGAQSKKPGLLAPKLILLSVVLVLLSVSGGMVAERFQHAAFLNDERLHWDQITWGAFNQAPILGYGLGGVPLLYQRLTTPANFNSMTWAGSAHNVYLQWLAQVGILGVIPMLALFWWIFQTARTERSNRSEPSLWPRIIICCSLLVVVHSVVEYSLEEPSIAAFWSLLLGVLVGFASQSFGGVRRPGRSSAAPLEAGPEEAPRASFF